MDTKFLTVGVNGLSVEFGNDISIETNNKVSAFRKVLQEYPIDGIVETIQTYRSIMIFYEPEVVRYHELVGACKACLGKMEATTDTTPMMTVCEVPVLYGGECGIDLDEVAKFHNKTPEEIIDIHSSNYALIYMFGFLPGMGYFGSNNGLTMPRRSSPRLKIEGGSIIIWNDQTIILPNTSPTGWNVIGHTPIKIFDFNSENPFLLKVGWWIKFVPVTQKRYDEIKAQVESGKYQLNIYEEEMQ